VLARVFKDIFPRYQTMLGKYVERKGGWDCHGLPVEIAVEQKLGLQQQARHRALRHRRVQRAVPRVGLRVPRGLDGADRADRLLGRPRAPVPHARPSYIESVWWALKTMWDRDLLFEGHRRGARTACAAGRR
jgi:isoleucyl-tRNA synthetase